MAILLPRLRHQHVIFGSVQFFDFEMMTMMMMLMVKSLNINPEWRIIHWFEKNTHTNNHYSNVCFSIFNLSICIQQSRWWIIKTKTKKMNLLNLDVILIFEKKNRKKKIVKSKTPIIMLMCNWPNLYIFFLL